MNRSTTLSDLLSNLTDAARAQGLNDTAWAARAHLRKETLSRLRGRTSCDFATLDALAAAVGLRIGVVELPATEASSDELVPGRMDRALEERLLNLCASRSFDPARWVALGPRFFMAGLAVMLASVRDADRRALLALAESLHPGATEPVVFEQWLRRSPLRPARFLPMLEVEARHAA